MCHVALLASIVSSFICLLYFPHFYFIFMDVLNACMSVYHMCAVSIEATEGVGFPRTRVTDSCELCYMGAEN
jgi:dolichol kinase